MCSLRIFYIWATIQQLYEGNCQALKGGKPAG
jgi:hypothetical protein